MAAKSSPPSGALAKAETTLRAHALAKPEATEHFPWGERAIKVKGKVFLFMYADDTRLSLSTKLPDSSGVALMLPFAKPTGYGLGKAGWVSAAFDRGTAPPPLEMLCAWIDESYQAVAPAKLASLARGTVAAAATDAAAKPAAAAAAKPAKPTAAKRPKAKPAKRPAAKPTAAKPTAAKPTAAKPAKPTAAKPAKPTATKPAATKPAATKPARRPA